MVLPVQCFAVAKSLDRYRWGITPQATTSLDIIPSRAQSIGNTLTDNLQMITAVGKAFVIVEVSYALGRHKNLLPLAQYTGFLKYDYLDWAQCFLVLAVTKISICLFLLRLSVFNNLRKILWGLISFLVISHLTLFFLIVFQCEPIHKVWDTEVQGTCFRKYTVEKIVIVQGVFSVVTDLICAAFPAVLLWRAKIGLRTKIALCLLMGLGVITAALSIARTCFAWQVRSDDLSCEYILSGLLPVFLHL